MTEDTHAAKFSIDACKYYREIPLAALNELSFSVYIVDYQWKYLFVNKESKKVFGEFAETLIGKSALDVFSDARFKLIFDKIKRGVEKKMSINETIYSPLRGKQIVIKGYPLEDCYYFATTVLPAKDEVLGELREELNARKINFKSK